MPLEAVLFTIGLQASHRPATGKHEALARRVAPRYFEALGIPLLAGRDLESGDERRQPVPVLINKGLGRLLFGEEDGVGKQLSTGYREMKVLEIVGIAGDVRQLGLRIEPGLQLYLPLLAPYGTPSCLVAKTLPNAGDLTAAIRGAVRSVDPEVPVPEIMTMDAMFSREVAQPRFYLGLLGAFAAAGLILAAIGIYGVMSYMVLRRTQEFGIRIALGAKESDILSLVVGRASFPIAGGIIAGLAGSFVVTRLLSSLLYGVRPNDPLTLVCVSVLLCLVALLASYLPARRAARTNPMVSLKCE
jgi:putative ABC transport system permease protein